MVSCRPSTYCVSIYIKICTLFHRHPHALSFRSCHPYISRRFPSSLQSGAYGPLHPTNCNLSACSVECHSSILNECCTPQQYSLYYCWIQDGNICSFNQQRHTAVKVTGYYLCHSLERNNFYRFKTLNYEQSNQPFEVFDILQCFKEENYASYSYGVQCSFI